MASLLPPAPSKPPRDGLERLAAVRAHGEAGIRALVEAGELQRAAAAAIALYGRELRRFLRVRLRGHDRAVEAFSALCEDFLRGLPAFGWRSSLRTWLFVLARHASAQQLRSLQRERRRETEARTEPRARTRTATAAYRRTESKRTIRELRERLDEDQQTLLILRIERGLAWCELAVVMGEVADDAPDAERARASARMRTRYQVAKNRLRALARESGLLRTES